MAPSRPNQPTPGRNCCRAVCNLRATRNCCPRVRSFAEFARLILRGCTCHKGPPGCHLQFHGFAEPAGYRVWNRPDLRAAENSATALAFSPARSMRRKFPDGTLPFRNGNRRTPCPPGHHRNPFKKKNLIFPWLGHCSAITPRMRHSDPAAVRIQFMHSVKRFVEYAVALGAALLASYLILQGRW